ncbi:MAG: IS66 family insertion sequence element accessory protein TnpB [Clostridiaceae bacterium]
MACGYTDMRKSIDGLVAVIQEQFHLDPFSKSLYLFCGKRRDVAFHPLEKIAGGVDAVDDDVSRNYK